MALWIASSWTVELSKAITITGLASDVIRPHLALLLRRKTATVTPPITTSPTITSVATAPPLPPPLGLVPPAGLGLIVAKELGLGDGDGLGEGEATDMLWRFLLGAFPRGVGVGDGEGVAAGGGVVGLDE